MRDIVDVGMGRWGAAPALRKLGVRVALAAGLSALTSVPASAATLVQRGQRIHLGGRLEDAQCVGGL